MDEWELSGTTQHVSLAAAEATANWLRSIGRLAGWEFTAATLADGTHRVLRRRANDRTGGPERSPGPAARTHRTSQLTR